MPSVIERRKKQNDLASQSPGSATPVQPTRTAHFAPGDAARMLAPTASFEAMTLDLIDWYVGKLEPGSYWFHLTIAVDLGVGVGMTRDVEFAIGEPAAGDRD